MTHTPSWASQQLLPACPETQDPRLSPCSGFILEPSTPASQLCAIFTWHKIYGPGGSHSPRNEAGAWICPLERGGLGWGFGSRQPGFVAEVPGGLGPGWLPTPALLLGLLASAGLHSLPDSCPSSWPHTYSPLLSRVPP